MNKVNFSGQSASKPQVGSIWTDEEEYYILAKVDTKYVYICLNDGNYWEEPFTDINDTKGLNLVTNVAKIEITPV